MKACFVMFPIGDIQVKKDSSLALLLAAQEKGWEIDYVEQQDLMMANGSPYAFSANIRVFNNLDKWFELGAKKSTPLTNYDVIFMRVDPPVDNSYLYTTQLLDIAEDAGVLVVNPPRALRDLNEKIFALHFPELLPPYLLAADVNSLLEFHHKMKTTVFKPLDAMGGKGVFLLKQDDLNVRSVIETLTLNGSRPAIAQGYIPNILAEGDRRVFLFDGEPYPQMLIRMPRGDDFRANLAAGGSYKVENIGEAELHICAGVKEKVKEHRLLFVGLDIIGGKLTEINITCPTGLVELAKEGKENPALFLLSLIEKLCAKR